MSWVISYMVWIHVLLDPHVWHACAELRMHWLESRLVHLSTCRCRAISFLWRIFSAFASRAFANGKTTDEPWRSYGLDCRCWVDFIFVLRGVLPPLPFHVEEIFGARKRVMQYAHQWCEHFRRDVRVDVCVFMEVDKSFIPKDLLSKLINLSFIVFSSEIVWLTSIIETFRALLLWWGRLHLRQSWN